MPVPAESVRAVLALRALIEQVLALSSSIRSAARLVHARDRTPPAQRELLLDLADRGARTVPDIARERRVTRQNIQIAANSLVARGLVQAVPNSRHKRSPKLDLTAAGRAAVSEVRRREGLVTGALAVGLNPERIDEARTTLGELRDRIERETGLKRA